MSAIFNSIDTAQRSQEGTGAAGEATGRGQSRRGTGSGEDEEGEGASRGRGKGQQAWTKGGIQPDIARLVEHFRFCQCYPPLDSLALLASTAAPITGSAFSEPSYAFSAPEQHQPVASTSKQPYIPPASSATAFFPESAQLLEPLQARFSPNASSLLNAPGGASQGTPETTSDRGRRSSPPTLSMTELAQAKEAALQNLTSNAPPARVRQPEPIEVRESDPIDMHVLSELQAGQLFEHYHTRMNAFIILLDPFLHTVNYVRNNSTVLFTSILAVSAKFLRPDLYPMLISSARHLTGRAIIDGKVSLGLIQSILLQVYWKEPEDRTAWLRIGEAIRMGFQLHLHDYRTTPLPDDETEARQTMDRERTWIDLCAFDQTFFLQGSAEDDAYHQANMHDPVFSVPAWLEETKRYGVVDDLEQGADFEWMKVQRLSKDIARAPAASARSIAQHVQGLLDASYARYLESSSSDAFAVGSRSWIRVNFWLSAASLAFARAMLTAVGTDSDWTAKWLLASSAFVDAFEIVAKHGYIAYWQDTLGITLFTMGEFCLKIFAKLYPGDQHAILGWME
ncbi:hypothetical protein NBRC10512_004762, partial [Rhodotorula toruloides]